MKKLTIILAFLAISNLVVADDLNPPQWRGQAGSTFQQWEFDVQTVPGAPVAPDLVLNPYGNPAARPYPGVGQNWVGSYGGRYGMWPLSGTIEVDIPNNPVQNPYKDIWVQITWAKQVSGSIPAISELLTGTQATLVQQVALNPTWFHSTYQIHLVPNPNFETVKIDGTIIVDELVIDTICIPEPATIAMLGFGAIALLRKKF